MPGFTIGIDKFDQERFNNKFKNYSKLDHLNCERIYGCENMYVNLIHHSNYPAQMWENKNSVYFLEGHIYNRSNNNIQDSINKVFNKNECQDIKKFIGDSDGEFLLVKYDKNDNCLEIFNDQFGNLPLFYHISNENIFITRDFYTTNFLQENFNINESSVVEYLALDYIVGEKTLFESVYKLPPGSSLYVNLDTLNHNVERISSINFDELLKSNTTCDDVLRSFRSAISNRVNTYHGRQCGILLSGGMDSRAVLAGLHESGIQDLTAISKDRGDHNECEFAKRIASLAEINHTRFSADMSIITTEKIKKYIDVQLSTSIRNLGQLYTFPGMVNTVTNYEGLYSGTFGDAPPGLFEPLPNLNKKNITNEDIVDNILYGRLGKKGLGIKDVSKYVGISPIQIRSNILEQIESYPEKTTSGKLHRFSLFEYGKGRQVYGLERQRHLTWPLIPLASPSLVHTLLGLDINKKKNKKLQTHIINECSPSLLNIPYYNWCVSIFYPYITYSVTPGKDEDEYGLSDSIIFKLIEYENIFNYHMPNKLWEDTKHDDETLKNACQPIINEYLFSDDELISKQYLQNISISDSIHFVPLIEFLNRHKSNQ